ncbi:hypothetical protein NGF19_23285 [Streptomyces sp. RY43-2]|uniref:Uncharacterized protein n=1 Tax=Streptomyces macrolidinus TaxID=2952607 RepID=A0ABT0ZJH0_9ACTN|nr:hypothetical protein [Streptomyces macrolidinus]MCN9243675.1 hypothetical protein [Streptomyces macrolidinus]
MSSQQPQYSTPVPSASPAQAPASAAPRRPGLVPVALLVTGLLVGGGAVGAAWALSGGDGAATGSAPADDARDACRALDGFDESKYISKGPESEIAVNRFTAAGALSQAAAAGDKQYKPLAEAVRRAQDLHARTFEFGKEVKQELATARNVCADL